MRWTLRDLPDKTQFQSFTDKLDINPQLLTLLLQRGIDSFEKAKQFFRPDLADLHDPFLMRDMDKAVERIAKAVASKENILIYGDYDVDGTTAVSLVYSYLREDYSNVATYIPDRYDEGYGISYRGIDFASDNDFSLIIALDCGIKAIEKVAYASQKGIDFIICDHHRPGEHLPGAVAVLDPKRADCDYPYKELCGCGIGFKLIQALASTRGQSIQDLSHYLDLVAVAVAADIVPITGENRILTYYGLQQLNTNPRTGILALIQELKKKTLSITDVVFIIAPRINAAGRMKHGNHAVDLLIEKDFDKALEFAAQIEKFNADRKSLDELITAQALQQIEKNNELKNFTSVVFQEDWHKGVIGIVASRLIETHYRPTLVFTKNGAKLAASARSVSGFDIYNALEACSDTIEQFGGHKYAAGLTLLEENYPRFKKQFEEFVKTTIPPELLSPQLKLDLEISLSDITPKFYRILKQFAPFGPGNMKPVFMVRNVRDTGFGRKVGSDASHLKLQVTDGKITFDAIGFGLGDYYDAIKNENSFDIAFTVDENEWNGTTSLQLNLRDIRLPQ